MIRFCSLMAVLLVGLASVAWGASYTWVGSVSQEWSTPGNWAPPGVPGPGDAASIAAGSVVVSAAVTVGELALPGPIWRTADGAVRFEVAGVASQSYRVYVSVDLKSWQPQATFVMPASTIAEYVDPGAAAVPVRYYRVAFVPSP